MAPRDESARPDRAAANADLALTPPPGELTPSPLPPSGASSSPSPSQSPELASDPTIPLAGPPPAGGRRGWLLAPGDVLADRFRIVRLLGRGGMGEVYEAEDLELGERVAAKTIRPELAADERVLERFKREIHLARQVTHPNVCRIYDLFRHRPSSGGLAHVPVGDITFLTMELLGGETLAAHIVRDGPLPLLEVRAIAAQMAAALDAAHAAGVVHRDFKAGNVQLLPERVRAETRGGRASDPSGSSRPSPPPGNRHSLPGLRVKVTDFGLARTAFEESFEATQLTLREELIGTPAYMAPEQVQGDRVGPAADIYAFGVVLFEMVTGRLPFTGNSALSIAIKRLNEDPPSARSLRPDLDSALDRTIAACLARDPEARPTSATEALAGAHPAGGSDAAPRRPRRLLAALGLAILLALAAAGGFLLRQRAPEPGAAGGARRAVAVLSFRNLAARPDEAWLSTALVEMLRTELGAGGALRTIPGESVSRAERDLAVAAGDSLGAETLDRLHRRLGADLVLLGTYFVERPTSGPARIRLDLRLQQARGAALLATFPVEGEEQALLDLVRNAGNQLRRELQLGSSADVEQESGRLLAMLPSDPIAARLYAEGLTALRRANARRARELLEQAVAADPDRPLVRAALAEAWRRLGDDARSLAAAEQAWERSRDLPPEPRLLIEGRLRLAQKDWPRAITVLASLAAFYPDDLDYGLLHADALLAARQAQDALAVTGRLQALPAPSGEDPRIDLTVARAALQLGDYQTVHRGTAEAVRKGEATEAPLVVAEARLLDGQALVAQSDFAGATAAYDAARAAFAAAEEERGVARVLSAVARVAYEQRELDRALGLYGEAQEVFTRLGDRAGAVSSQVNVAMVRDEQGETQAAIEVYEAAIRELRDLDDRSNLAKTLGNAAIAYKNLSRFGEAERAYEEAIAIREAIGEKPGLAYNLLNYANLQTVRGRISEATVLLERAVAIRRELGEPRNLVASLSNLANLRRAGGDLAGARQALAEAETLAASTTPPLSFDGLRIAAAALALSAGELDRAETLLDAQIAADTAQRRADSEPALLRTVVELERGNLDAVRQRLEALRPLLAERGVVERSIGAELLRVRLELAAGDAASASRALERARTLAAGTESVWSLARLEDAAGRIAVALADRDRQRAELARVDTRLTEVEALGLHHVAFELAVTRGQLRLALGEPAAPAELIALAARLEQAGFLLLAREAAAAAR